MKNHKKLANADRSLLFFNAAWTRNTLHAKRYMHIFRNVHMSWCRLQPKLILYKIHYKMWIQNTTVHLNSPNKCSINKVPFLSNTFIIPLFFQINFSFWKIVSTFTSNVECISPSLFSVPSGESTVRPVVVPETTYCVCEKEPHRDINPQNNNPIDNAWGRPFEAMENRRVGRGGPGRRDSFLRQLRRYHSPIHGCTQVYYLLFN